MAVRLLARYGPYSKKSLNLKTGPDFKWLDFFYNLSTYSIQGTTTMRIITSQYFAIFLTNKPQNSLIHIMSLRQSRLPYWHNEPIMYFHDRWRSMITLKLLESRIWI